MSNPPGRVGVDSISITEFLRTRDSVVTGLTKLNGAIGTLISAYVNHTNHLLSNTGQTSATLDTTQLTDYLANAGLAVPRTQLELAGGKEKKKRIKKEKDPNAPKRPLTAFFLFSTRAREHIKRDLGQTATPVEINNEILRRWNDMSEDDKERWKAIYNNNYEEYKEAVEAYRIQTGQDVPVEPLNHDASIDPAVLESGAGAEHSDDNASSSSESEEEVEPVKEPTPPPKKKASGKGKKKTAVAESSAAAPAPAATSPSPSAQLQAPMRSTVTIPLPTPNEKRKKTIKEESPEQPKKKKSRKSEAASDSVDAPAPVAAAPEKKKKKSKKSDAA